MVTGWRESSCEMAASEVKISVSPATKSPTIDVERFAAERDLGGGDDARAACLTDRDATRLLISGAILTVVFVGCIILFANVPSGYDVLYGLSHDSVPLFRSLWPYPNLALDSSSFSLLAASTILLLWGVYLITVVGIRSGQKQGGRGGRSVDGTGSVGG